MPLTNSSKLIVPFMLLSMFFMTSVNSFNDNFSPEKIKSVAHSKRVSLEKKKLSFVFSLGAFGKHLNLHIWILIYLFSENSFFLIEKNEVRSKYEVFTVYRTHPLSIYWCCLPRSTNTAESSCLSRCSFPSQSYLWKKGFRMFFRRNIDFSDTFKWLYSKKKKATRHKRRKIINRREKRKRNVDDNINRLKDKGDMTKKRLKNKINIK